MNTGSGQSLGTCRKEWSLAAPAKLNLGLSIVGRRSDGYHLLESLFWPITFADDVTIATEGISGIEWAKNAPNQAEPLPMALDNLATRALAALSDPRTSDWAIRVRKRIPIGSGLGGGSSNAGTVLRHYLQLHPEEKEKVERAALSLGADVPFFLKPTPTWVSGVGETRVELKVSEETKRTICFLLVLPPEKCVTKQVFEQFRQDRIPFSPPIDNPFHREIDPESLKTFLQKTKNDLEAAVTSRSSVIRETIAALKSQDVLYAGLSGSGSTCFAVFPSLQALEKSAKDLSSLFRSLNCKSVKANTYLTA